jgi:hypothetical protein
MGASWRLAGAVKLVRRWHPLWLAAVGSANCLQLIRQKDTLSPLIRAALGAKQIVPEVTITTPEGSVTLVDAQVLAVAPAPASSQRGSIDTLERERYSFTFPQIEVEEETGGRAWVDDWSAEPS